MIEDSNEPTPERVVPNPLAPPEQGISEPVPPPMDGASGHAAPFASLAPRDEAIQPALPPSAFAPAPIPSNSNGQPVLANASAAATAATKEKPGQHEIKDSFREIVETVVFVVVLVLLLKGFLAEAFVIPTGSMATTLLGYHQKVTCPECGYSFSVNMSKEIDPEENQKQTVTGCTCPNCFKPFYLPGHAPDAPRKER